MSNAGAIRKNEKKFESICNVAKSRERSSNKCGRQEFLGGLHTPLSLSEFFVIV
jgi:hypothetical protein